MNGGRMVADGGVNGGRPAAVVADGVGMAGGRWDNGRGKGGNGGGGQRWAAGRKTAGGARDGWLGIEDSNLCCLIQSQVSYR